jgi:hypothetical protein
MRIVTVSLRNTAVSTVSGPQQHYLDSVIDEVGSDPLQEAGIPEEDAAEPSAAAAPPAAKKKAAPAAPAEDVEDEEEDDDDDAETTASFSDTYHAVGRGVNRALMAFAARVQKSLADAWARVDKQQLARTLLEEFPNLFIDPQLHKFRTDVRLDPARCASIVRIVQNSVPSMSEDELRLLQLLVTA